MQQEHCFLYIHQCQYAGHIKGQCTFYQLEFCVENKSAERVSRFLVPYR